MHSTRFLTSVMTLLVSPLAKKPGQWFNPNAFLAPISTLSSTTSGAGVTTVALSGGAVGNLGRDTLTGPGMTDSTSPY